MPAMNPSNISPFAALAGVAVKTLQRWDSEGQLKPAVRTPGNRRLYTQEQLNRLLNRAARRQRGVVASRRVSSQAQKPDLGNQKAALEQFCNARGIAVDEWIAEIGGGLNFKRPKFSELVERILRGELSTLVIAHQDRLARKASSCWRTCARPMTAKSWCSTRSRSAQSQRGCKT